MSEVVFRVLKTDVSDVIKHDLKWVKIWEYALFIPEETTDASTRTLPFWYELKYIGWKPPDKHLYRLKAKLNFEVQGNKNLVFAAPVRDPEGDPNVSEPITVYRDGPNWVWNDAITEALSEAGTFFSRRKCNERRN